MIIKDKIKSKIHKKRTISDSLNYENSPNKSKFYKKLLSFLSKNKRKIFAIIIMILIFCMISFIVIFLLVNFSFAQDKTYSKAFILGENVGGLNNDQLINKIKNIKSNFDKKNITLINSKDKYVFELAKTGITIDINSTSRAIWKLNNLNLIDKFKLITGGISNNVKPIVSVDDAKCNQSLSAISILPTDPIDATIYFENGVKIKSEKSGKSYNTVSNCREMSKTLAKNLFSMDIYFDVIKPSVTKKDLESELSRLNLLVGKSLSLHSDNYQLDLSPDKLIDLLEIKKNEKTLQIDWSQTKLDELVNSVALKVDKNDTDSPTLDACQYLKNSGGNWLDKEATKKIFKNLTSDTSRIYSLPISYHKAEIGTRTPVPKGNNGTVYLTYDDGLTYANQIMDYAACYGVKVTFFELGSRVGQDAKELHRAIAEGHAVQTHGYEHAATNYGTGHDYSWQYNDIASSITAITNTTGVRPKYFRPPGGNRSQNGDTNSAAANNNVKLILWDVSSTDTVEEFGSQTICENVVSGAFDGASVLMHSTKQKTADAMPCIVENLAAKGFNMEALN